MNIVVTGGTGFVGSSLVKKLISLGFSVTVINRSGNDLTHSKKIKTIKYNGDYEDLNVLPRNIDLVIHLATHFLSSHKTSEIIHLIQSNITFGTHLLEYMSINNIKNIINVSTYAQHTHINKSFPQNLYSASKAAFEKILEFYVNTFSMRSIVLEMYDVYGLNDSRSKFIDLILNAAKNNQMLNMSLGEQEICYVYLDDVIEAFLKAMNLLTQIEIGSIKYYSIYGKQILNLINLVELVSEVINKKINTNLGFFPYRQNEIMKVNPTYPILESWEPQVSLTEGISIKWNQLSIEKEVI